MDVGRLLEGCAKACAKVPAPPIPPTLLRLVVVAIDARLVASVELHELAAELCAAADKAADARLDQEARPA